MEFNKKCCVITVTIVFCTVLYSVAQCGRHWPLPPPPRSCPRPTRSPPPSPASQPHTHSGESPTRVSSVSIMHTIDGSHKLNLYTHFVKIIQCPLCILFSVLVSSLVSSDCSVHHFYCILLTDGNLCHCLCHCVSLLQSSSVCIDLSVQMLLYSTYASDYCMYCVTVTVILLPYSRSPFWSSGCCAKVLAKPSQRTGGHRPNEVRTEPNNNCMRTSSIVVYLVVIMFPCVCREDGTLPYHPEISLNPLSFVNYNRTVARIRDIYATPSGLESTCLLFVCGLGEWCSLYTTRGVHALLIQLNISAR